MPLRQMRSALSAGKICERCARSMNRLIFAGPLGHKASWTKEREGRDEQDLMEMSQYRIVIVELNDASI